SSVTACDGEPGDGQAERGSADVHSMPSLLAQNAGVVGAARLGPKVLSQKRHGSIPTRGGSPSARDGRGRRSGEVKDHGDENPFAARTGRSVRRAWTTYAAVDTDRVGDLEHHARLTAVQ